MLAAATYVLAGLTGLIGVIYFVCSQLIRIRRPGEPEIPKGHPLWGNAVDFGTHAVNFLHKCESLHGSVFTLRLLNQFVTIIVDPHCYESMSKERNFDFDPIQKQVNMNVFSFETKEPQALIKNTAKAVRGKSLIKGIDCFVKNLDYSCEKLGQASGDQWTVDGLREFASKTMFSAIFNSLFGFSDNDRFNASMVHTNFDIFHKYFNFLWLGIPNWLFPKSQRALENLLLMPDSCELMKRSDLSETLKIAMEFMKNNDQTEGDIKGHNLVYLHVNYNTYRLSFWCLSNLLEDEKAYGALYDEISNAVLDRLDEDTNTANFTMKDVESLKLLDSFVNESIRMASGVFMVRYVKEDTYFTTSDGKQHLIRKGDRVAMYPPAIHKDPKIFQDPLEFKYDRFVDTTFYKGGKAIKTPVNGHGTLCPGKRFSMVQLKWYIMSVLMRFDIRQHDGQRAEYAVEDHGQEVLPPRKDISFEYRQKESYPIFNFVDDV